MKKLSYIEMRERLCHLVDDLRRLRSEVINPDLQNFLTRACNDANDKISELDAVCKYIGEVFSDESI